MNGGREAFGGINRGRIIFPDDSGLILDLQAGEAPEGGGNGERVTDFRRDYSGIGNDFDVIEGPGPIWLEEGLNGKPTLQFEGDSLLTMSKELIGQYDSYTIISLARYSGEKRGRVISSSNNNWLFGFHQGSVGSWFTGKWLHKGQMDNNMDWRLQSAVANLDGNNILISWDNGEIVHSGEIDVESSYRSIGKMSIGGWRGREEQASECEIARVLVFNRALEEQEVKHYEFMLKRMYSIMDYSPESYLDWAMGLLRTGSLMGLVAQEAAEIALSQGEDGENIKELFEDSGLSESSYHRVLSDFLFRKDDEKFAYHLYMAFFLDPGNPNILADLLRKTSEGDSEGILEAINLVEMMCIDGNNRGLEQSLDTLRHKVSNSNNENFSSFFKENEDLLERGRFREFFEETNKFLLEHGSLCSNKLIDRLDEVGERPEIRKLIIDKLNEYSNSRDVIRFSTEYFKFGKRKNVGGFADRIKGATTVMLLSIALERRFEIDWKYPFDIEEVFVCDDYDWTVKNPDLEMNNVVLIDSHFTDDYKEIFGNGKIAEEMEVEDKSMEAYCNLYFDRTLLNDNGGNFLSENEKLGVNQPNLVGTMLSLLGYRPNLIESTILNRFFSFLEMYEQSIAIHFRTGGDGSWEDPVVDSPENVHKLFEKAKRMINDSEKKTCVYFATDSDKLKRSVLNEYGGEMEVFSLNIPLAHIDRSTGSKQISGSRFSIMENYMISLCDHILAGKGAFSVLAANRRYQWPWRYYKTH